MKVLTKFFDDQKQNSNSDTLSITNEKVWFEREKENNLECKIHWYHNATFSDTYLMTNLILTFNLARLQTEL